MSFLADEALVFKAANHQNCRFLPDAEAKSESSSVVIPNISACTGSFATGHLTPRDSQDQKKDAELGKFPKSNETRVITFSWA